MLGDGKSYTYITNILNNSVAKLRASLTLNLTRNCMGSLHVYLVANWGRSWQRPYIAESYGTNRRWVALLGPEVVHIACPSADCGRNSSQKSDSLRWSQESSESWASECISSVLRFLFDDLVGKTFGLDDLVGKTFELFGIRCIYLSCDVPWCSKHLSKTSCLWKQVLSVPHFQRLQYHNAKLHTQTTISNFHQAIPLKCPNTLPAQHLCHVHLKTFPLHNFFSLTRPAPRCQKSVCTKRKRPSGNKAPELPCLGTSKKANDTGQVMDCQNMSRLWIQTPSMAIYGCYPGGGCALTITGRPSSDSRIAWAKVASQISTCAFDAGPRISGVVESRQVGR